MTRLPYLCHGCRAVSTYRFTRPLRSFVGRCRRCGKRRRHAFFGRRPLSGRVG